MMDNNNNKNLIILENKDLSIRQNFDIIINEEIQSLVESIDEKKKLLNVINNLTNKLSEDENKGIE